MTISDEELNRRLKAFLDNRDSEDKEGLSFRGLLKLVNDRDQRYLDAFHAEQKKNSRDHEAFSRRLAEHGHRIGSLEVEIAKVSTEVERVERDSGEWRLKDLEKRKDSLRVHLAWWQRQAAIWIVGVLMLALGAIVSFVLKR